MDVDPATARHRLDHAGKTYYFCCGGCLEKFRADPDRYLNPKASANLVQLGAARPAPPPNRSPRHPLHKPAADRYYVCPMCPEVREESPVPCPSCGMALEPETLAPISKIEYTCPMHPEIIRSEPGSCPICGMALEPRTVTAHEEENPELRNMTRRFWVSLLLTSPLLVIAMADMLWPHAFMGEAFLAGRRSTAAWLPWIELALATPSRSLGRMAVLPARMGLHRQSLHQHVHADRDGHRRRLLLQPHRDRLPADLSAGIPRDERPA